MHLKLVRYLFPLLFFLPALPGFAQEVEQISGVVWDSKKGVPLIGANVIFHDEFYQGACNEGAILFYRHEAGDGGICGRQVV